LIDDLSAEFGQCLLTDNQSVDPDDVLRPEDFFTAPAWEARRRWVAKHPRLAKANPARDVSPPGWYQRDDYEKQGIVPVIFPPIGMKVYEMESLRNS